MLDLQEILYELKAGKKLRLKCWPADQYIHYWNKVVLDQTGGLVDIVHCLAMSRPDEWEACEYILCFKDLKIGDKFRFVRGEYIRIKTGEESNFNHTLGMDSYTSNILQEVVKV